MSLSAKYGNWVAETTATTGTGTLTLAGALAGTYAAFSSVFTDGDDVYYHIFDRGSDNQEAGLGTYSAGTVTRGPTSTLVSGVYDADSPAAVTLSGNAVVYASLTAETSTLFATETEARLRKDGSEPMTGELILSGDATQDLGAVTKQQLDTAVSHVLTSAPGKNLVDNGSFTIWQRGTGPAAGFVADRWRTYENTQMAELVSGIFKTGTGATLTTPTASTLSAIAQGIELLTPGTANQFKNNTFALSFSVSTNEAGTIYANAYFADDSVGTNAVAVFQDTTTPIPALNTVFNYKATFTVTADSLATSKCLLLRVGVLNSTSTSSSISYISDIQLEEGEVATPFEIRHPAVELVRCQRYYYTNRSGDIIRFDANGSDVNGTVFLPVSMRVKPVVSATGDLNDQSSKALNVVVRGHSWFTIKHPDTTSSTTGWVDVTSWTADAEL